jgi:hypothetical protein
MSAKLFIANESELALLRVARDAFALNPTSDLALCDYAISCAMQSKPIERGFFCHALALAINYASEVYNKHRPLA